VRSYSGHFVWESQRKRGAKMGILPPETLPGGVPAWAILYGKVKEKGVQKWEFCHRRLSPGVSPPGPFCMGKSKKKGCKNGNFAIGDSPRGCPRLGHFVWESQRKRDVKMEILPSETLPGGVPAWAILYGKVKEKGV